MNVHVASAEVILQ